MSDNSMFDQVRAVLACRFTYPAVGQYTGFFGRAMRPSLIIQYLNLNELILSCMLTEQVAAEELIRSGATARQASRVMAIKSAFPIYFVNRGLDVDNETANRYLAANNFFHTDTDTAIELSGNVLKHAVILRLLEERRPTTDIEAALRAELPQWTEDYVKKSYPVGNYFNTEETRKSATFIRQQKIALRKHLPYL
ncbi:protein ORF50 [Cyprinid herpesvirus 1]|uniref:Protein ORF50 n=1 Tax=Cyprinid herpesvirus 1 TaxID=317858 RepID=K7PCK2_9VIRU|nr:protein ORF50 [Cyprinid herpesvirus 1]AFJ20350.1 protein ORF50 [Cyprinid herpesvirus 1]